MKIAICNHNELTRRRLVQLCKAYHTAIYEIDLYTSENDLLESTDLQRYDMMMLQLCEKGLYVKQELCNKRYKNRLLFVGNDMSLLHRAFGKNVYGCISLPVDQSQMYMLLDQIMYDYTEQSGVPITDIHDVYRILDMKDITNIYSEGNYSITILRDGTRYLVRRSLKEWMLCLDVRFIRAHRSYVVNMDYIKSIKEDIMLTSGDRIPVARSNLKHLYEAYAAYHRI